MKNNLLFKKFILSKEKQKNVLAGLKEVIDPNSTRFKCVVAGRVLCDQTLVSFGYTERKCKSECDDRNGTWYTS